MPPILVPNVDDVDELAHHIRIMFYITAGVATLLFILVVFGKICHGVKIVPIKLWIIQSTQGIVLGVT